LAFTQVSTCSERRSKIGHTEYRLVRLSQVRAPRTRYPIAARCRPPAVNDSDSTAPLHGLRASWVTALVVATVIALALTGARHRVPRLLLPHGRPGHGPVHRQRQPRRRLLRLVAGSPRVRHRGRQQVVRPRQQRTDRRRHQPRHPRRALPLDPAPVPRGVRFRRRTARIACRRRHLLGRGGLPASGRRALVHPSRRADADQARSRDRDRPAPCPVCPADRGGHQRSCRARAWGRRLRRARRVGVHLGCCRSLDRRADRGARSPSTPSESKTVQAIAARARVIAPGTDPLELAARARVRTRSGAWLLVYGTRLNADTDGRTAVIIHPVTPQDVAPVIALSPTQCRTTSSRSSTRPACAAGVNGRTDLPRPLRHPRDTAPMVASAARPRDRPPSSPGS
jgi:hypothetical protein